MSRSPSDHHKAADAADAMGAGQRRQVTVLFADMAGYTALAERLGEERTYLLMQRVHRALSEAVHQNEGTVQEVTGDGVMALFGAPAAIEDAPLHACRAALDIQARAARLAQETPGEDDAPLGFRVGLHSGPLVVGEVGDAHRSGVTALGDTVNLASRIEGQAGIGEVLLSEATHALVEGYVDAEYAGEHAIRGKAEPQKLWRLDAVREGLTRFDVARGRGLTPLVGRDAELATLKALWHEAGTGAVRAATLLGEPGIGKSRLAWELARRVDDGEVAVLEGHCTAGTRGIPFAPLIQVVRAALGIPDAAGEEDIRQGTDQGLATLGLAEENVRLHLLDLLGHAPQDAGLDAIAGEILGIRRRDAILALLRARCRAAPTLMTIDDLQWSDTASEGLLQRIVRQPEPMPLLVVATARSGYRPPWRDAAGAREIVLEPLPPADSEALLRNRLGTARAPDELARLVADRCEGNPLFAEEIMAYLRQTGAVRVEGDEVVLDAGTQGSGLPVTVQNLLMERMDRLDDGPRAVLEAAAVIGPRFAGELAVEVAGMQETASGHLDALMRADLIQAEAGGGYRFRHGLAREAMYDSLLTPRRQALHERVAAAIEAAADERPENAADVLAHHWRRTARSDKAAHYLALAAEASLRVYSLDEAEEGFRAALALIEADPGCADDTALADVVLNLARILYFKGEFFAIIALVEPYLPRIEALGDKRRLARFLFEIGYAHVFAAHVDAGRSLLSRAQAVGEEIGDPLAVAYAELGLMWDRMLWGTPGQCRQDDQRKAATGIIETALAHGDVWLASKAQVALAGDLQAWGRTGEARAALAALMDMSRDADDPRTKAMALWGLAALDAYGGDHEAAIERADESLRISLGPIDRDSALVPKATAMILGGRIAEGVALVGDVAEAMEAKGLRLNLPAVRMVLGAGAMLDGRMAQGARTIRHAVAQAERWGQTGVPALGRLLEAEIAMELALRRRAPPSPARMLSSLPFLLLALPLAAMRARRRLERVLAELRDKDMPMYVAQCLYDLGLLAAARGDAREARSRLAEARAVAQDVAAEHLIALVDAEAARLDG